jgi:hypothetical protein
MDIIYGLCHETTSNLKTRLSLPMPSNFPILNEADHYFYIYYLNPLLNELKIILIKNNKS